MVAAQTVQRYVPALPLSVGQRNWMLFVLTLVGVCSSTDRAIITTVLEPVKLEFGLSDGQLGLLSGLAFASTYTLVILPAGALADRVNRRKLIAAALAAWSLLTLLCGAAQNFVQLLAARMGVGAGEAGGHAATLSSVGDLFPPERRATAISIYYLNAPAAALLAGAVGGLVTAAHGWRAAMVAAALPGLLLSLVLLFCRDIPREGSEHAKTAADAAAPSFGEALRFVGRQRALIHLIIGVALVTTIISGQGAFSYAFFMREHGMSLRTLGPLLGISSAAILTVVLLSSGMLADRLAKRDPGLRLWLIVAVLLVATPAVMLSYLLPQPYALALYLVHVLVTGVWQGPAFATAQNLAPPQMRATLASIMLLVNGLVGVGLGPVLTGFVSDAWSAQFGGGGLRAALILTTALGFWAALHFWLATRTLKADLARVQGPV
ncbi:MFS transporter [Phenylobacterium sp. LjRoot219]|uniref:MFS transporter n=1 Tax=Phenylobacterium sp. LjRoot219 TaxID=3342283 RepID=UPI003ECD6A85